MILDFVAFVVKNHVIPIHTACVVRMALSRKFSTVNLVGISKHLNFRLESTLNVQPVILLIARCILPKITKLKNGGYCIEIDFPTHVETVKDENGTTQFVYVTDMDFKKLVDLGEQFLLDEFITKSQEDKERWKWN